MSIAAARSRARALAASEADVLPVRFDQAPPRPTRRFVMGDPQAPLDTILTILAHNGLLADDGWLAPDVELVSVGDHFDWGRLDERHQAGADGLATLSWLAAHPAAQVTLIAGNHDLARVGELCGFDDNSFASAHRQAVEAYRGGDPDAALEAALLARYPALPSAEVAARDLATFSVAQRELVRALLERQRLSLAAAIGDNVLVTHAGVTHAELDALGVDATSRSAATIVAAALNQRFYDDVRAWLAGDSTHARPLAITGLHQPGDAAGGEGGGMLYHRPCNPDAVSDAEFGGPRRRRYDARTLPLGLTQVIGHISDRKCRQMLGSWVVDEPPQPGSVRHLFSDGRDAIYRAGCPSDLNAGKRALMVFVDGGMNRVAPEHFELLPIPPAAPPAP